MKSGKRGLFEREILEERITAWLLGELNPAEIARIEEKLREHPELAAFKQQMAATIGWVRASTLAPAAAPVNDPAEADPDIPTRLSAKRRRKLFRRFRNAARKRPFTLPAIPLSWIRAQIRWAAPIALAASVVILLSFQAASLLQSTDARPDSHLMGLPTDRNQPDHLADRNPNQASAKKDARKSTRRGFLERLLGTGKKLQRTTPLPSRMPQASVDPNTDLPGASTASAPPIAPINLDTELLLPMDVVPGRAKINGRVRASEELLDQLGEAQREVRSETKKTPAYAGRQPGDGAWSNGIDFFRFGTESPADLWAKPAGQEYAGVAVGGGAGGFGAAGFQIQPLEPSSDEPSPGLIANGTFRYDAAQGALSVDGTYAAQTPHTATAAMPPAVELQMKSGEDGDALGLLEKAGEAVALGDVYRRSLTTEEAGEFRKQMKQLVEVPDADRLEQAEPTPTRTPTPRPRAEPLPEIQTVDNPFSTFSLNVSDVAFKLAQASLDQGQMPDPAAIRSEEFINAMDYHDPAPSPGAKLAFHWQQARNPFEHNRNLARFSIQTAALGREPGRPLNLVILLDNSGSMERSDRVRIVRVGLGVLAQELKPTDRVSVVAFARQPRLWVDGALGGDPENLLNQVGNLNPQGGTNLELALNLAYATAERHFIPNGNNRVILMTDGAANLGEVNPASLKRKVESFRRKQVALDCFGIGWEGYNDDLLELLSRHGDGRYGFINNLRQARVEFADQLAGALRVTAANVKAQVEFNPDRVLAYRQIGYEKHQLTREQFRDDSVDAAEIAAAESGTALYSYEPKPNGVGPLGIVRVRFQSPATGQFEERKWLLPYDPNLPPLERAYPAMRLCAVSAAFAEWMARSPFAGNVNLPALQAYLQGVPETYPHDARPRELATMIRQARQISGQ